MHVEVIDGSAISKQPLRKLRWRPTTPSVFPRRSVDKQAKRRSSFFSVLIPPDSIRQTKNVWFPEILLSSGNLLSATRTTRPPVHDRNLPIVLVLVVAFPPPFRLAPLKIEDEHEHDNEHD
jgi:hypothetical protein